MSQQSSFRSVIASLLAVLGPLSAVWAIHWLNPHLNSLELILAYGVLPLSCGLAGVLLLPLHGTSRTLGVLTYILVVGALLSLRTPILLVIACMLGDCL